MVANGTCRVPRKARSRIRSEATVGSSTRKAHLDPFPLIARYQKGFRLHLATSYVASRSSTSRTIRRAGMLGRTAASAGTRGAKDGREVVDRVIAVNLAVLLSGVFAPSRAEI